MNEILANMILPELLRVWPGICPQIIIYSVMDLEIAYVGTWEQGMSEELIYKVYIFCVPF